MDNSIEIYQLPNGNTEISVKFQQESVWLTQAQLVELYQSSKANISEHIKHIFEEGELSPEVTVRKFRTVRQEGNRQVARDLEYYNLDMIISLGYRIKSQIATHFRIWATQLSGLGLFYQSKTIGRAGENHQNGRKHGCAFFAKSRYSPF